MVLITAIVFPNNAVEGNLFDTDNVVHPFFERMLMQPDQLRANLVRNPTGKVERSLLRTRGSAGRGGVSGGVLHSAATGTTGSFARNGSYCGPCRGMHSPELTAGLSGKVNKWVQSEFIVNRIRWLIDLFDWFVWLIDCWIDLLHWSFDWLIDWFAHPFALSMFGGVFDSLISCFKLIISVHWLFLSHFFP